MRVFKFGGASLKDADGFRNVASIIKDENQNDLVVTISAIGKTTNALEEALNLYFKKEDGAAEVLESIRNVHFEILNELFDDIPDGLAEQLDNVLNRILEIIAKPPVDHYDYMYDQIVSKGEFLSTHILAALLYSMDITCHWMDVRNLIRTDNTYREAKVDWETTEEQITTIIKPIIGKGVILTQGFIGGTPENFATTLGREGSDFSAAIFAFCLDADSVTIWKDVTGVLNTDPRFFSDATHIPKLSYKEAIEMTYYGAKVIHPKTIKPLQNKDIPLIVRSFIDRSNPGTIISSETNPGFLPPVLVKKKNQVLIHIATRDFSFIAEDNLGLIFSVLAKFRIKVNMMQNMAISFSICVDNDPRKIKSLQDKLSDNFEVKLNEGLSLYSLRHYNENLINSIIKDRKVWAEERIRNTVQLVVSDESS